MTTVNYAAAADFYTGRTSRKSRGLHYRRFTSAAEAVRFVAEEVAPSSLNGSLLEVDEQRFEGADILALYTDCSFPLTRRKA
jgi:hypothetical protein